MKGGAEQNQKEIFLFRHGKTEANEKHLYCGKTDLPLSEKGRSELLEKKESRVYPDIARCKVFTSGLLRTTQSLGILYPEIASVGTEPSFQEIDFGDFEMKSYEELKNDERYKAWVEREVDRIQNVYQTEAENPCPNGESWLQMKNRVLSTLENALDNYRSVAIFTHGGVISAIMGNFFPNERKSLYDWQPDFGEGYKIVLGYAHSDVRNHHLDVFQSSRYEKIPSKKGETC